MSATAQSAEAERTPNGERVTKTIPARPSRRRWQGISAAVVTALAALYFGGHWYLHDRHRVYTDDAAIDTDQIYVTSKITERIERILVDENQFVHRGQLLAVLDDATERAALNLAQQNLASSRAAAKAARNAAALESELQSAQIHAQSGGVEAARRAVSLSQAQAKAVGNTIAVARAQLESARSQIAAIDAAIPAAKDALRKAELDRDRDEALARQGYVATSTVDSAVAAASQARAAYDTELAQRKTAQAVVRTAAANLAQQQANAAAASAGTVATTAQIPIAMGKLEEMAAPSRVPDKESLADAAKAQADALAAQVRMAQLALNDTRIVAPVDGWVALRNAQGGQTVSPGQALVTLSPANRIFVTANYKETQLPRIKPGMPVDITVDACGGAKFRGSVVGLAPVALNTLSTLPALTAPTNFVKVANRVSVRISLPRPTASCMFRPGTAVETAVIAD
jgi:membrane fusion protein (multidrug efflux system)